jgi:hypothetical protein
VSARHVYAVLVVGTSEGVHDWIERGELECGVRFVHFFKAAPGMRLKVTEDPECANEARQ